MVRLMRIAVTTAMLVMVVPAQIASAHCPGQAVPNNGRLYASGGLLLSSAVATGIRASIGWTNPNPCTTPAGNAFTLEVVNVCKTGQCSHWAQVGWIDRQTYASPKGFCETHDPGATSQFHWAITAAEHSYRVQFDALDGVWDCIYDGAGKASDVIPNFTQAQWLVVQGETNAVHGQIGANAPAKLLIRDMQYRNGANWPAFNPNDLHNDAPFGVDEPAVGQFRNWTNAH